MNNKGSLIVIAAPSGAGKTTLVSELLRNNKKNNIAGEPKLKLSISHTTRAKRPGEQDGINYYFVSDHDFKSLLEQRAFIEYAKVYDYFYGTSKIWLENELDKGNNVILEIDWQGAQQIKAIYGNRATFIYILPPSLQILEQRLRSRAQDSEETIKKRFAKAKSDIEHYNEFDYIVINDDIVRAINELTAIITSIRLNIKYQSKNLRELINQLLG